MRTFIVKTIIFLIPVIGYALLVVVFLPHLLKATNGPSTQLQIEYSFENAVAKDYEILILGNSRLYRGINPGVFNINTYNFSHDNDSFNQMYYKLEYLSKRNKEFKYLILGVDYFQFSFISDTRNYVYGALLGDDYLNDYEASLIKYKIKHIFDYLNPRLLFEVRPKESIPVIKENGQFIKQGQPEEDDFIQRDICRIEIQVRYFEKILDFCKSREIIVFLVMLPTRENELRSYKNYELCEFNDFLINQTSDSVIFLNFCNDPNYKVSDFTDLTHLNERAADRFSSQLNDTIIDLVKSKNLIVNIL